MSGTRTRGRKAAFDALPQRESEPGVCWCATRQSIQHARSGSSAKLAPADSLEQVLGFKDPYMFDSLGNAHLPREHEAKRCLPMRAIANQTATAARAFLAAPFPAKPISVHVLMGGVDSTAWRTEFDQWIDAQPRGGDGDGRGE